MLILFVTQSRISDIWKRSNDRIINLQKMNKPHCIKTGLNAYAKSINSCQPAQFMEGDMVLTLSQTTNFLPFQTERVCK